MTHWAKIQRDICEATFCLWCPMPLTSAVSDLTEANHLSINPAWLPPRYSTLSVAQCVISERRFWSHWMSFLTSRIILSGRSRTPHCKDIQLGLWRHLFGKVFPQPVPIMGAWHFGSRYIYGEACWCMSLSWQQPYETVNAKLFLWVIPLNSWPSRALRRNKHSKPQLWERVMDKACLLFGVKFSLLMVIPISLPWSMSLEERLWLTSLTPTFWEIWGFKKCLGVGKMVQSSVKDLRGKHEDLDSIPDTHALRKALCRSRRFWLQHWARRGDKGIPGTC